MATEGPTPAPSVAETVANLICGSSEGTVSQSVGVANLDPWSGVLPDALAKSASVVSASMNGLVHAHDVLSNPPSVLIRHSNHYVVLSRLAECFERRISPDNLLERLCRRKLNDKRLLGFPYRTADWHGVDHDSLVVFWWLHC